MTLHARIFIINAWTLIIGCSVNCFENQIFEQLLEKDEHQFDFGILLSGLAIRAKPLVNRKRIARDRVGREFKPKPASPSLIRRFSLADLSVQ